MVSKSKKKLKSNSPAEPGSEIVVSPTGRALVVDDDPEIAQLVVQSLERVGYVVDQAASAREAVRRFEQSRPDVLISDWQMPDFNGIELAARLKKIDPNLAVILMTGFGDTALVVEAFHSGRINYYLSKPFKINELFEVVAAAVRERKLTLSDIEFRSRLEDEIRQATSQLEKKNELLQHKQAELESLYQQLRARQSELEETNNYLENLLESSVDGIVTADEDETIDFFSRGAEAMFGYKAAELTGQPLRRLFPPESLDLRRLRKQLSKQPRIKHFETELLRQNGQKLVSDLSAARLRHVKGDYGTLLIIKDIAEQKRLEEELRSSNKTLERLSLTDGLTNLYNHRHFQSCLADEFQRTQRFRSHLSLIMLDLDDFKLVNDDYGHQVGDQVLILVSDLIRQCIREVDTPARYGGEEFAIVLPQTGVDSAIHVAERIKEAIEKSPRFQNIQPGLRVTASLGLAGYPDPRITSQQDLIRLADRALYRAKNIGKNRVVLSSHDGEKPLGRGELLTHNEKKTVLRRVNDILSGHLDLERMLDGLLGELAIAFRDHESKPDCAVMLIHEQRGLDLAADTGLPFNRRPAFIKSARAALEFGKVHVSRDDPHDPVTSAPITVERASNRSEVAGVISVGAIPSDLDFFRDIVQQAALGIVNAKLCYELKQSKATLEKRVDELLVLNQMGTAFQRNASVFPDFHEENKKLLARCLTRVGFNRVLVFDYDAVRQRLTGGVDGSLRGNSAPGEVAIGHLPASSPFHEAQWGSPGKPMSFQVAALDDKRDKTEGRLINTLGLGRGQVALAPLAQKDGPSGLVLAAKDAICPEDRKTLSTFVLHAGPAMVHLTTEHDQYALNACLRQVQSAGADLLRALLPRPQQDALARALEKLNAAIPARELSLYRLNVDENPELVTFISETADPEHAPAVRTTFRQSKIMGRVLRGAAKGRTAPVPVADLEKWQKAKPRGRYATRAYMGVPLVRDGRVFGILNLADPKGRKAFNDQDMVAASVAADTLAPILAASESFSAVRLGIETLLRDVVGHWESMGYGHGNGHTQRVVDVSVGLARAMQVPASEMDRLIMSAWLHDLDPARSAVSRNTPPLTGDAIEFLMAQTEKKGNSGVNGESDVFMEKIIAAAEAFDLGFLGLNSRKRPRLQHYLENLLLRDNGETDPRVLAALITMLTRGLSLYGKRKAGFNKSAAKEFLDRLKELVRQPHPVQTTLLLETALSAVTERNVQWTR